MTTPNKPDDKPLEVKAAPKVASKEVDKKEELHKKIETILAQNGGQEANIPVNHEYWDLLNQYRALK